MSSEAGSGTSIEWDDEAEDAATVIETGAAARVLSQEAAASGEGPSASQIRLGQEFADRTPTGSPASSMGSPNESPVTSPSSSISGASVAGYVTCDGISAESLAEAASSEAAGDGDSPISIPAAAAAVQSSTAQVGSAPSYDLDASNSSRDGGGSASGSGSGGGGSGGGGVSESADIAATGGKLGKQLWNEAQDAQAVAALPPRRKRKKQRPAFLDTMGDVEASQNALLASASTDESPAFGSSAQSMAGSGASVDPFSTSGTWDFDEDGSPAGSVDWEEVTAQVAPAYSAEYIRETRSSTQGFRTGFGTSAVGQWLSEKLGRISYGYYCWRKDSTSDLLVIMGLNVGLLLFGAAIKMYIIDQQTGSLQAFWAAMYNILDVVFGQDLPDADASFVVQAFGVAVASVGLASFALVLALVEQIVLEVIDSNVKTGSSVYEAGHMLVLAWADNRKDLEVVWKILSQACLAYRAEGGRVIVVLSSRDKLEMEALFRRTIPDDARYGSTFVFRQGNPLVPDDLRSVAASRAAQICVVSDTSRYPSEADAQSLRAAVLLDELDFPGVGEPDPRTGDIIVELKTANAVPLLRYSCSTRIMGLATAQLNARRMARIIKSPVVGLLSNFMWSFNSQSQTYMEPLPQFVGRTFGSIAFQLPDAIPYGIVNPFSGMCKINPAPGVFVNEGDQIVMLRPTSYAKNKYKPAAAAVQLPANEWDESTYVCSEWNHALPSLDAPDIGEEASAARAMFGGGSAGDADGRRPTGAEYLQPLEYTHASGGAEKVLICGWGEVTFMSNLLRELDHGPAALPRGSQVVLFNQQEAEQQQEMLSDFPKLRNIQLMHIKGNPLNRKELDRKIDIERYKSAVVLCDMEWIDPDLRVANGIAISDQNDMLRLDAMLMTVQLNIRKMLEDAECPAFNCIVEKCAFEGVTRFEDGFRLPLGISINFPSFAASILLEVAFNPGVLVPFSHLGEDDEMRVQDASCFTARGERTSFWELQRRAQVVGQVLLGWMEVPPTMDQPLTFVINPVGATARGELRVWNNGDQRLKLVTISQKDDQEDAGAGRLRSRFARSAIQETDGSRLQSVVTQPPLRHTSTITEELLEAAALNYASSSTMAPDAAAAAAPAEGDPGASGSDAAGGDGSDPPAAVDGQATKKFFADV